MSVTLSKLPLPAHALQSHRLDSSGATLSTVFRIFILSWSTALKKWPFVSQSTTCNVPSVVIQTAALVQAIFISTTEKIREKARSIYHWMNTHQISVIVVLTGSSIGGVIAHRLGLFKRLKRQLPAMPINSETHPLAISKSAIPPTNPTHTILKTLACYLTAKNVVIAVGIAAIVGSTLLLGRRYSSGGPGPSTTAIPTSPPRTRTVRRTLFSGQNDTREVPPSPSAEPIAGRFTGVLGQLGTTIERGATDLTQIGRQILEIAENYRSMGSTLTMVSFGSRRPLTPLGASASAPSPSPSSQQPLGASASASAPPPLPSSQQPLGTSALPLAASPTS